MAEESTTEPPPAMELEPETEPCSALDSVLEKEMEPCSAAE